MSLAEAAPGRRWHLLAALLVVALAAALLLPGLQWGLPSSSHPDYSYHPDETALFIWAQWLSEGIVIPRQFIFGGTLYSSILAGAVRLAESAPDALGGINLLSDAILVARILGGLSALLSVLLVFEIGRRLFRPATGLLAALLLALAPAQVALSVTARPDALASLVGLVHLYLAVRVLQGDERSDRWIFVLAGVWAGMTVALRFPIAAFAMAPVAAYLLRGLPRDRRAWVQASRLAGSAVLMAIAGYCAASPHSLLYGAVVVEGLRTTLQYESSVFVDAVGRGPGIYQYGWLMLREALGTPLHLLALGAVGWAAVRRQQAVVLILAGAAPYFVLMTLASWVVVRYTLPLLPWFCLLMAACVVSLLEKDARYRPIGALALLAALLWTLVHDVAFLKVLGGRDVRDRTAEWIESALPAAAGVVTLEYYAGDVYFNPPLSRPGHYPFPLTGGPHPRVLLDHPQADYLVVHENIYAGLERLRGEHPSPQLRALLEVLESGRFELQAEFRNPVTALGVDFGDRFTSLDYRVINPAIRIYRRSEGSRAPTP